MRAPASAKMLVMCAGAHGRRMPHTAPATCLFGGVVGCPVHERRWTPATYGSRRRPCATVSNARVARVGGSRAGHWPLLGMTGVGGRVRPLTNRPVAQPLCAMQRIAVAWVAWVSWGLRAGCGRMHHMPAAATLCPLCRAHSGPVILYAHEIVAQVFSYYITRSTGKVRTCRTERGGR